MRLGGGDVEGNTRVRSGRDMASRSSRPRGRLLCALGAQRAAQANLQLSSPAALGGRRGAPRGFKMSRGRGRRGPTVGFSAARRPRGPAYLYLVLRSNDLDAFYCTPPEQRKDPSKPGGDACDEDARFYFGAAARDVSSQRYSLSQAGREGRHDTSPRRCCDDDDAPRRRSSHTARRRREGDKFTQVAPDLPLRLARALRQRPLVGRARRRRQALGF